MNAAISKTEFNELGTLLKNRLIRKHEAILNCRNRELWAKCIEIEGEISAIEIIWEDLMRRGLLT